MDSILYICSSFRRNTWGVWSPEREDKSWVCVDRWDRETCRRMFDDAMKILTQINHREKTSYWDTSRRNIWDDWNVFLNNRRTNTHRRWMFSRVIHRQKDKYLMFNTSCCCWCWTDTCACSDRVTLSLMMFVYGMRCVLCILSNIHCLKHLLIGS